MGRGGFWNANSRRSGGDRKMRITGTPMPGPSPLALSIQCFEQRHHDCTGIDTLFGGRKCECSCHVKERTHG